MRPVRVHNRLASPLSWVRYKTAHMPWVLGTDEPPKLVLLGSIPRRGATAGKLKECILIGCNTSPYHLGSVEQRSARHPVTVEVVGSNPIRIAKAGGFLESS